MVTPQLSPWDAVYFDGVTANRRPVKLALLDPGLVRVELSEGAVIWAVSDLTAFRMADGALHLSFRGPGDEALVVPASSAADRLERQVRLAAPRGLRRRAVASVAGLLLAAGVSVFGLVFWLAPALAERLAPVVPVHSEIALGNRVADVIGSIIGDGYCEAPAAIAALESIAARLDLGDAAHVPLSFRILGSGIPNAFAAPGGVIVFSSGIIRLADSPDAVAAVMAHEAGHVVARDPVRETLRAAGSAGVIGLLIGDVAGGAVTAAVVERLVNASYSREAERSADRFAIERLRDAFVSLAPFERLFQRISARSGTEPAWLQPISTHPDMTERLTAIAAAAADQPQPLTPSLPDAAWLALRAACEDLSDEGADQ